MAHRNGGFSHFHSMVMLNVPIKYSESVYQKLRKMIERPGHWLNRTSPVKTMAFDDKKIRGDSSPGLSLIRWFFSICALKNVIEINQKSQISQSEAVNKII